MLQILVADDHALLRQGVRAVLEARTDWAVCAEATNGEEAAAFAEVLHPDVALVDLEMPGVDGLEATRRIRRVSPRTDVLIYTGHDSRALEAAAASAGARGYILKSVPARELVSAVETIASRRRPERRNGSRAASLSRREREVVKLLASGRDEVAVASALGIGIPTVRRHRARAMEKLGLGSVAGLVHSAAGDPLADR
jgi:DNA-binding NarL/FixJ family response regulator